MPFKFKTPKNGSFFHYCGQCRYWEFEKTIGCSNLGVCTAIIGIPTPQDAYDKPCGLFQRKGKR